VRGAWLARRMCGWEDLWAVRCNIEEEEGSVWETLTILL